MWHETNGTIHGFRIAASLALSPSVWYVDMSGMEIMQYRAANEAVVL